MVRVPAAHSTACWLCGTNVRHSWRVIFYVSQLTGRPLGRRLCWDCHCDVLKAIVQLRAARS